jgi:hypothetical protein
MDPATTATVADTMTRILHAFQDGLSFGTVKNTWIIIERTLPDAHVCRPFGDTGSLYSVYVTEKALLCGRSNIKNPQQCSKQTAQNDRCSK